MGILTASQIKERLRQDTIAQKRITITPLLNEDEQLRGASVDVRLGNYFISFVRGKIEYVDPKSRMDPPDRFRIEEETFVPFGRHFVLHPRQFVIGGTLEYFGIPLDLVAFVTGRSSWGRLGLVVATATGVHPGYRGIISLELANLGEVPMRLYPGWPLAQVFFHTVDIDADEVTAIDKDRSHYYGGVKPETSHLVIPESLGRLESAMGRRVGDDIDTKEPPGD